MTTTQLRRYELKPELQDHFVAWWSGGVVAGRAKYGFTILAAFLNHDKHEFTWIVQFDGDEAAFKAAESAWMTSAERAELFAGEPTHTNAIHVGLVEQLYPV